MLLVFLFICHLSVLTVANPFHKYPFVFLLDVGNEELKKTNTEQIRVALPGGSLAIRYPATGDGDTIAHVRVSGIDFGTDLKANIVDGGPGYKYVIIVFMGNPGVPYDAVVTVQTLPNNRNSGYNTFNIDSADKTISNSNLYQVSEDDSSEDNADDANDSAESKVHSINSNGELMQSSSNIYNYAQNEVIDGDDYKDYSGNEGDPSNSKDIHNQYSESYEQAYSNENMEVKDYIEEGDDDNSAEDEDETQDAGYPKAEKYSVSNGYITNDDYDNEVPIGYVDSNLYDKYKALRPHLYDNVKIYPQESIYDAQDQSAKGDYYSAEDPAEIDQMFNDEEIHNDAGRYKDSNNNYFDTDDSSAVAY